MIIEAKKEGNYFELPAGVNSLEYSIPNISRDNPDVGKAIKQVAQYCQERGIPYASVANGHQIISRWFSEQYECFVEAWGQIILK